MTSIILIFLAFALIHSITVTMWFKDLCRRAFGETFMRVWYRFLYTCVSGITAFAAVYFISLVPDRVLWQGPLWFRLIMHAIQIAGILFGVQTFQYLDKWEFMGFRQVWRYLTGKEVAGNVEGLTQKELVTTGVYGIVRHPLVCGGHHHLHLQSPYYREWPDDHDPGGPVLPVRHVHRGTAVREDLRRSIPGVYEEGAEDGAAVQSISVGDHRSKIRPFV